MYVYLAEVSLEMDATEASEVMEPTGEATEPTGEEKGSRMKAAVWHGKSCSLAWGLRLAPHEQRVVVFDARPGGVMFVPVPPGEDGGRNTKYVAYRTGGPRRAAVLQHPGTTYLMDPMRGRHVLCAHVRSTAVAT